MAQSRRQQVGRWGEAVASRYLEKRGYQILARNARTPYGEIDLVARQKDGCLVFVEVKTRTNVVFGLPEEAVDARKLKHMVAAAEAYWLAFLEQHPEIGDQSWRIDVIAVQGKPGTKVEDIQIEHFENVAS